jgi:hypothetical protein
VSPNFSDRPIPGSGLYTDLHCLASQLASDKESIASLPIDFVETVFFMLLYTKVLSYS